MTTTYNINNANLKHYYPFDANFLDYSSGTGVNNATTSNVTISTSNPKLTNGSLLLPGTTNQVFQLPTIQFAAGGLTVACWMKCNAIPVDFARLFDFAVPANPLPTKYFVVGFGLAGSNAGIPYIAVGSPSTGPEAIANMNYTIPNLNWHHFAFVIQSNSVLNFYVDGTLITGVSYASYPSLDAFTSAFIGKTNWSTGGFPNCNINQFVIFNRPITSTEVSYLYNYPTQVNFSNLATGIITTNTTTILTNGAFNLNTTAISQNSYRYVGTAGTGQDSRLTTAGNQTFANIGVYFPNWSFFTREANNNAIIITNGNSAIRVTETDTNIQALNVQQYPPALLIASQSIQLSAGIYVLTYRAGPRYDYYYSTQKLSTSISSSQFGTVSLKSSESFVAGWTSFTHTITINTSGVYSIDFTFENVSGIGTAIGIGTANGTSIALTDVILTSQFQTQYPCFLQGSKILRFNPETYQEEYAPIETLRKDDLIPTAESGYKLIQAIGHRPIPHPKNDPNPSNRLYTFTNTNCPTIFEPLHITGEHCTLHRNISAEKRKLITEHMGDVYITEEFYRIPAHLDDRAEPYEGLDEPATIWHFALENEYDTYNYGVYANGLLVESSSIRSLLEKSGMNLICSSEPYETK
jgi:hypothetical protein